MGSAVAWARAIVRRGGLGGGVAARGDVLAPVDAAALDTASVTDLAHRRHASLAVCACAEAARRVSPIHVGWARPATTNEAWHTHVSVGVVAIGATVVGVSKVEALVRGVSTLPRVRATDAVVCGRLLDGVEGVVHVAIAVTNLLVVLCRGHAGSAEQAVGGLGAVTVVARPLAVVASPGDSASSTAHVRRDRPGDVWSDTPTSVVRWVTAGERASANLSLTVLAVVAGVSSACVNPQELSTRTHAVCGVRVALSGRLRTYWFPGKRHPGG